MSGNIKRIEMRWENFRFFVRCFGNFLVWYQMNNYLVCIQCMIAIESHSFLLNWLYKYCDSRRIYSAADFSFPRCPFTQWWAYQHTMVKYQQPMNIAWIYTSRGNKFDEGAINPTLWLRSWSIFFLNAP